MSNEFEEYVESLCRDYCLGCECQEITFPDNNVFWGCFGNRFNRDDFQYESQDRRIFYDQVSQFFDCFEWI